MGRVKGVWGEGREEGNLVDRAVELMARELRNNALCIMAKDAGADEGKCSEACGMFDAEAMVLFKLSVYFISTTIPNFWRIEFINPRYSTTALR